ncbi:hypothetical protein F4692_002473 [Nocardioides cavernae]|uniref:Uncharacterized protein n=1 Tax=Nocardioides cavernae TaxID=1921566 RepID=A0A7Y9H3N8_9ACTN|nr:hypothetical protein [Nocardioides cavernae]NYE37340.1 hypothetical protein [Nocardioides cavernae]
MYAVPEEFRTRPFLRAEALARGLPRGVLQGPQFRRIHEAVYCHVDHEPSFADRVTAARLALPDAARTTGITRIQELGVDHGPRHPLHFVVEGDLHLAIDGVFLHRTVKAPPQDDYSVTAAAALVAYCTGAVAIDAIKVGCELLRSGLLDLGELEEILREEPWRRGVPEATYVLPYLTDRCRSMPEAGLLTYVTACGLPVPEVNVPVEVAPGVLVTPDLWFRRWRAAAEYEGSHHQEDRAQYNADIDRYAAYRQHDVAYALVTKERLRTPAAAMRTLHALLASRGYDGPRAVFGAEWDALFLRLPEVVRPSPRRRR